MPSTSRTNVAGKNLLLHQLKAFVLISLFSLSFINISEAPPAPMVVGDWRCDEGTGTTLTDASGNSHNGTLTNGPTWTAGKYGQAFNLDGTNDFVSIADHANFTLTPTQSYTWSSWVKNNNFTEWGTIWSQTLNNTNFFYFYAHTSTDAEAGPVTNGVSVFWYSGSNKLVLHSNNNVLTAGTWSYVTVTYDGSLAQANRFTIYVNGTDVTNRADVVSTGTIAAINPTNTRIGSNQPFGEYLNAAVDEVRYYTRLLSLSEIQGDMNIGNTPDTETPVTNITAPAAGNVAGTINVTANATDNVGVTGVQFLLDGVNLGTEDLSAPYSVSWNTTTITNGPHTLTARASDAAGNITTSAPVAVTVNNDIQAPAVSITAPSAGTVSGTLNVTADATDNIGVAGVQFLLDGNNLGTEDVSAPYSFSWNTTTIADGNHTLTARARDAAGNITTSTGVIVNVLNNIPDTESPTVTITAPLGGTISGAINVTANANDNIGVVGVQFLLDGVNLSTEDLAAPYSVSWGTATATNGSHTLTARARDVAGNITTSTAVIVNVNNTNLVAAYGFNENTGTTANDNSGNNNTGTLTNGPVWSAAGRYGAAVQFDGTNDFVNIVDANSLDLTNGMTIEAWVNPSNLTGYKTVICKENGTSNLAYVLSANNNTSGSANQRPNSRIRIGSTTRTVTGTTKLALSTWTHIASTYDGTTMRFYVNGVQVSTFATTGNITATTNPLRIGGSTALGSQYFAGLIDEVRIYNRALTQVEIQTDMNTPIAPDVTNPTVSITAPVAGNVSGTVNVTANATDNIAVTGVQFLLNGANLGAEDLTAPYSISWNTTTVANGNYTLTARARDAAGNIATSTEVIVNVNNDIEAPAINLTAPNTGTVNGTLNVTADATDNVGVAGVQFLLNGVNLGAEDISAPYSTSWNTTTVTDGSYTVTARARDAAGNITTSAGVIVNVLNNPPDTESPTVNITAPAAGNVTGTVNIDATANDNVGVVGVQFLLNGNNLGTEDISAPYSFSWNTTSVTNGSYTLTARARDAAGNTTTSAEVIVNVANVPDTESPTVNITAPAAGDILGTVNITANANDNTGVVGVQFRIDGVNFGAEDLTAPYSISWNTTTVTNGGHTISAIARDAAGNPGTAVDVIVIVNNDLVVPAVNITAPAAGPVSGTVNISANASDNVGVAGVQFLLNNVAVGAEDLVAPYTVSWNTLAYPNGSYTITARARDAAGNLTTSAGVIVTVTNQTNLIAALNMNEGTGTAAADASGNSHNGTLTNGPTWVAGKYSQGVNLDGTNDFINIADHNNFTLDPAQNYTWSAWIKNNTFTEWGTVWSQTVNASSYFYFYAHTTSEADGGPVTNGVSVYWWSSGSAKLVAHTTNGVLALGQWSHVTVTYNASQAQNNRLSIYVNGADVTMRTDIASAGTITAINPTNIRLGSNQPFGEYFNGAVDEVRFYNRLLTPAEVVTDMNTPIGADNIAPVVNITSPANGTTVSGTVNITANANDNFVVAGVQFLLDGVNLGAEDVVAPYTATWNSTTSPLGDHVLTARARDAAGNFTTSSPVNVYTGPDFSFTLQETVRQTVATGSTDFKADIAFLNGFTTNNIALSVSGLPANVSGSFVVNPMTQAGVAQLNITTTNAALGSYPITLTAIAEGRTHTQQATLLIAGPEDFALNASPASQSVVAGNAVNYTINITEINDFVNPVTLSVQGLPAGVTATFNPTSGVPPASSVLTLSTTIAAPEGTHMLTVRGISGAITRSIPITLTISSTPPSSLSLPPGFSVINIGGAIWNQPMGTAFTNDGQKMFVWEKGGKVFVCNRNAQQLYDRQGTPVLDIEAEVGNWADHGLMSMALDPSFSNTTGGYIYLLYVVDRRFLMNNNSIPADQGFAATIGRVTRYKVIVNGSNEMVIDPSPSERKVLIGETKETGIPVLHDSHGMGSVVFASDGTLLVSAGDGANYLDFDVGSDPASYYVQALADGIIRTNENVGAFRSQLLNCHNGKILRIDPATGDGISSNPFYDALTPRAPKSRVWTVGLRNPYRINVRPGNGSTNPSAGDIGEIYVGDVGMDFWEEMDIITEPGMNCGWPLYEGLESNGGFINKTTLNRDEPNPLAGGSCPAFFEFRALLKQATADGVTTLFNPCSPSTPIPNTTGNNRFFHRRPAADWRHDANIARVGTFNGNNPTVAAIGTAASGVTGSQFRGNSSIGGTWYTGTQFPAEYRNTYFHADYGAQWLKNFKVEFTDALKEVKDFASGFGAIISLTENPADGTLYCIDLGDNTIKRISYGGNRFPVLKMTSDKIYGPSALTVNFTGSNSVDPDGGALTYLWDFGDNTTSTQADPSHVFISPAGTPARFAVKLTVRDNLNASVTDSIIISVNNTPPVVNITSPIKNSLYNVGIDSTYTCTAVVTDAEHNAGQLKYRWQTILRHNNHEHPGPIDTVRNTSSIIARVGCNGDTYYYLFRLTVTDAAGLSTMDSSKIFPNCTSGMIALSLKTFSVTEGDSENMVNWTTELAPQIENFELERSDDGIHFYTINKQNARKANGTSEYNFNDNGFATGVSYYRLRMNEIGDVVKYSPVIKTFAEANHRLIISPNPATGNFSVHFNAREKGNAVVKVHDIYGRVLYTGNEKVNKGYNIIYMQNMPFNRAGMYIVTVQQGNFSQQGKMIYQNLQNP